MAKRAGETGREPGRNRLAGTLFSLLPAAMILGLLAPDVVETQLVAAQSAVVPAAPSRMAWQPQHFKAPLLVPSELLVDHGIDLVEISGLVERVARALEAAGGRSAPTRGSRLGDLIAVQEPDEEEPFVDDDELVEEEIFRNMLEPALKVDLSPVWIPEADVIEWDPSGLGSGYSLFVDFAGNEGFTTERPPAPPVPEPGTGALLSLGLIALALRRRVGA